MTKKTDGRLALLERTRAVAHARAVARLAELVALIRRRMTEVVESFYDVGEALREVVEEKRYAAAGHKSFNAFLKAEGLMSPRQASKLIAVVRRVPREQALALGQERAFALVAYTDATPEDDSPASLVAQSATIGDTPVARASVREIAAATRAARAKRTPTAVQRATAKADAAIAKAVRAALIAGGIRGAEVTVGRAGVRIALTRIQGERLARKL
jgi:hypothetical protein